MRRFRQNKIPSGRELFGKLRTNDYRKILEAFGEIRRSKPDIEREAIRSGSMLSGLLQEHGTYWWAYYNLPLQHLTALILVLFGWKDDLIRISQSDNPGQNMLEFMDVHDDPASEAHVSSLEPGHQAVLFNAFLALLYSLEAVGYYSLSINELLNENNPAAKTDLLKAVAVDRMAICTATGQKLVSHAQLTHDKPFLRSLFKKMKDPHAGLRQYVDLRVMRRVLAEAGVLAACTDEQIANLICDNLGIYRSQTGNEVKSLAELLRKWALDSSR